MDEDGEDEEDEHVDDEEDWGEVQVRGCGGGGKVTKDERGRYHREDLHRGVNKTTRPDVHTLGNASAAITLLPHGGKDKREFGYG